MIVKMKKIFIVVSSSRKKNSLEKLQDSGVLHIENIRKPDSPEIEDLKNNYHLLSKALSILKTRKMKHKNTEKTEALKIAKQVVNAQEQILSNSQILLSLNKEKERIEPVGNFSPVDLTSLKDLGLCIRIYSCNLKQLSLIPKDITYEVIKSSKSKKWIIVYSKKECSLPFEEFVIPEKSLNEIRQLILEIGQKQIELNNELDLLTAFISSLEPEMTKVENELEFHNHLSGMENSSQLVYLKGFCPINSISDLKETCLLMNAAYLIETPLGSDEVPTLITNPKWLRIIEPVFNFMNTTPGQNEYDVSFWFLTSLTLFFAMLIGDGGYGIIYLILAVTGQLKFKKAPIEPFILFYVFSIATIIWGAITGTWFGSEYIAALPGIKSLIIPKLNSFTDNSLTIMRLSFFIGIIHLTIAHIWRIIRYFPSLLAVSQIGWIIIIWYLYFLAKALVLGNSMPPLWLFTGGVLIAYIFSSIKKFTLETFIVDLITFVLNIISSFGDIVSYIRLFAVGAASLAVAVSCNNMASRFGWIISVLILFCGHGLNFILGALAVIVHGIRLNMLEFSSHLDMTWAGKKYSPFKKH